MNPFSPLTRVHDVTSRKTVLSTPVVFYVGFVVTSSLLVYPLSVMLQELVITLFYVEFVVTSSLLVYPLRVILQLCGIMEKYLHFFTSAEDVNCQLHAEDAGWTHSRCGRFADEKNGFSKGQEIFLSENVRRHCSHHEGIQGC